MRALLCVVLSLSVALGLGLGLAPTAESPNDRMAPSSQLAPIRSAHHNHRFRNDKESSNQDKIKAFTALLTHIASVFEKNNVTYWLEFGTALGAYRDKKIIPWDGDSDMGILHSERPKVLKLKSKIANGSYDVTTGTGHEDRRTFLRVIQKSTGLYTDLYNYKEDPKNGTLKILLRKQRGTSAVKRELILPPSRCELEGQQFYCPAKLKEYLDARYTTLEPNHKWNETEKKYVVIDPNADETRYKP